MKVNLQKKRAVAAAMLLTMCCYGQAWAALQPEQSVITISADGTQLNIVEKDTKTYDPTIAANANHLKQHDGVYYFENNNGQSFDSIEWSGEGRGNGLRPFKDFLAGDRNYTVLTKQLTITKPFEEGSMGYGEPVIIVGENKTINFGKRDNRIEKINMTGNVVGNGTVNIFAKEIEWTCGELGRKAQYEYEKFNLNLNADKIKIVAVGNYGYKQCLMDGIININQDPDYQKKTVQIEGTIGTENSNSKVRINFYGQDSYFEGRVLDSDRDDNLTNASHLTFDKGARWHMNSFNTFIGYLDLLNSSTMTIDNVEYSEYNDGFGYVEIKDFKGSGGIIKMSFDGSKQLETANPAESFLNIANHGDFVTVTGTHKGDTSLILKNTSNDTSKVNGRVLVMVKDEQGSFNVKETEGALSWENYKLEQKQVNPDDYILRDTTISTNDTAKLSAANETWTGWTITDITRRSAPTTSTKTLLSTITAGYDTWRNDTDKFNERMGELRMNGAGSDGVWVRTKGSEFGRHSSNGSYTNKQQTYQLGYDAVTSKDEKQTTYTGVAAEYGKGSLTFDSGTGTMKSLGLGVYQSQLRESGHYLDLTYRFDKYKNDFHVADSMGNPISGKYGNNAMSLSAEYGRKNALKHGWYVEPQSEVTLGYMFGNDFTTSNNIRVEQKNMPALIGRLGLNIGREVSDKVNFYVKASVNHDFLGNYDMHMTDMSTGERLNASDKFGSSWFDYGAGLSVKTGKDSYAYFDIERAVGGEYKKNWDWNAGVRWSF